MSHPLDGGVVLITGASSGIGREIAREMASRAKALALVARRVDRMRELEAELVKAHPKLTVTVHACDLVDRASVDRMLSEVEGAHGTVDVLVNNAGFGDIGCFDLTAWDKNERMIALNVTTLTYLTHKLVPKMVAQKRGGILNISSGFGLGLAPGFAVYSGTKHYVTAFTDTLRMDLRGTGVVVTQVCPGPVATEFEEGLGNFTGHPQPKLVEISPSRCARAAMRAFLWRRAIVIPGTFIWLLLLVNDITPRFIRRIAVSWLAGPLRRKQLSASRDR